MTRTPNSPQHNKLKTKNQKPKTHSTKHNQRSPMVCGTREWHNDADQGWLFAGTKTVTIGSDTLTTLSKATAADYFF